jgi:hypothetical protein
VASAQTRKKIERIAIEFAVGSAGILPVEAGILPDSSIMRETAPLISTCRFMFGRRSLIPQIYLLQIE